MPFDGTEMSGAIDRATGLHALEHERVTREELEQRQRELEQRLWERDELLATIAHDLRTPLNTMIGWIQLLRSGASRDPRLLAEGLEVVERSARLQTRRVAEFADASRLASGRTKLVRQHVNLRTIVDAATVSLERPLRAESRIPPGDLRIEADPERLPKALAILIALAAEPDGTASVDLEASAKQGVLEIRIGCGPPDTAGASSAANARAEGLDAFFVRSVIALHGGTLRAEGTGARPSFVVTLPLAETFAFP